MNETFCDPQNNWPRAVLSLANHESKMRRADSG
jgi:hypothetical protein